MENTLAKRQVHIRYIDVKGKLAKFIGMKAYIESHGVLKALPVMPASLKTEDPAPIGVGVDEGLVTESSSKFLLTLFSSAWASVWDAAPPIVLALVYFLPWHSAVVSFPFSTVGRCGRLEREVVRERDLL